MTKPDDDKRISETEKTFDDIKSDENRKPADIRKFVNTKLTDLNGTFETMKGEEDKQTPDIEKSLDDEK